MSSGAVAVDRKVLRKDRVAFIAMLCSAIACLVASFVLSVDAVTLAKDSNAVLSCNLNAVINCGKVAVSDQSQLFGFPNSFLGLICEPIVIMIAVAGLSGVRFPRWMMFVAQLVYALGIVFAFWLFYQSAFVIGAFCPWCLLVTLGTTVTFFTMLRFNVLHNNLFLSGKVHAVWSRLISYNVDYFVVGAILSAMICIIISKYGSFLFA